MDESGSPRPAGSVAEPALREWGEKLEYSRPAERKDCCINSARVDLVMRAPDPREKMG